MSERFQKVVELMARLRAADGCPWDRKQTHESLKPYLLEETYEVLETIDRGDEARLKEELGDVLLQILFHTQIASERGTFTMDEVLQGLADKLVRRHPHVFGPRGNGGLPDTAEEVVARWETIKRDERQRNGRADSVLDGVPKTLPALLRAYQVQARASRVGFDWPKGDAVLAKVEEEIRELRHALAAAAQADTPPAEGQDAAPGAIEAEFGDVLFSLVNLARFLRVNPEEALRKATDRFTDRFRHIETEAARAGRKLEDLTLAEMDRLWDEAKRREAPRLTPDSRS
ncbi:nucleoside triphosphate pyrophosphohydrolase [Nitrospira sp. Kam-Ns4a]